MAVAALSTSAIALTASTTPASPTPVSPPTGETAPAFAKLVAQAKPEEKAGQETPNSEAGAEAEGETLALPGDEAAPATPETKDKEAGADQPLDLLADIEAMVAAAGQITVAQPAPVPVAQAAPVSTPAVAKDGAPAAEPVLVGRTITRLAASSAPVVALRQTPASPAAGVPAPITDDTAAAVKPETQGDAKTPVQAQAVDAQAQAPAAGVAPTAKPVATDAPAAPIAADGASPTEAAPVADAETASARPAARGNIATLIASLKSAFTPGRAPADAPVPVAAPVSDAAPVAEAAALPATPLPTATNVAAVATETNAPTQPAAVAPEATVTIAPETATAEPTPQPKAGKPAKAPTAPVATAKADVAAPPQASAAPAPVEAAALPADAPQLSTGDEPAPIATASAAPAPAAPATPAAPAIDPVLTGVQPASQPMVAAAPADGAMPGTGEIQQTVERHLDLARDSQWLDRLARDISQAATQQGQLKFHLNPEHLGALTVEIANSAAGTAIKLTADTDQARTIIADAQPQLIAEVRAQGLRVSETHVELNNQQQSGANHGSAFAQNQQGQAGQQRQSSADHQPFARTQATSRDDAGDSAAREDGELYA